jgi:prenyltransferase beta subunit
MIDITNYVQNMVLLFNSSHFYLNVASHQDYDADVHFNENNVTMYLSELEEYISSLITYLA